MKYDKMIFATRLKEVMEDNQMNGSELSRKIGVDKSAVCRYLSGEHTPRLDTVYAIADVLNVNPAWLVGLEDNKRDTKGYHFCPWCGKRLG